MADTGLLVIEDGFINKMLANPRYLIAFPFLKQYAAKAPKRSCGGCGRKSSQKSIDYTEIKRTLVAMPTAHKAKLLDLTGRQSVRIFYRDRHGKVNKLTITRGDKQAA